MRICLQRVLRASVTLPDESRPENSPNEPRPVVAGQIGPGLLILLGVGQGDGEKEAEFLARKCCEIRIFEDESGRMNRSLSDIGGAMLVVSQFTLYADCRKGRRPGFTDAASPEEAERLYGVFCDAVRRQGVPVETGVFRTEMHVELLNAGPVTIWLDTKDFYLP